MFGKKFGLLAVLSIAALTLTVAPVSATSITTYTDLATWTAASSGTQLIDFENGALGANGVSFTGLSGSLGVFDTSLYTWMNYGTYKADDCSAFRCNSPCHAGTATPQLRRIKSSWLPSLTNREVQDGRMALTTTFGWPPLGCRRR